MTSQKIACAGIAVSFVLVLSGQTYAQQGRPVLERLRSDQVTLFDVGMKNLRRLSLDAAENYTSFSGEPVTTSVGYKQADDVIDIVFNFKVKGTAGAEALRVKCEEVRRESILKMFRIGLTDYGTNLSTNERIRRRIGVQFAHEPVTDINEVVALGEQLGKMTYFQVNLVAADNANNKVSCRALVSEPVAK